MSALVFFAPFAFFAPGPIQLVIVLVVVVMLFGNRIPSVMRSLGLGITEFKKGIKGELPDPDDSSEKIEDKQ
jgi:sec-independent protein translocase protein TatA